MFDTVCKFLVETFSTDFAAWLLGEPIALTELSPSELSLEPIRADALMLLQSATLVLHIEFQVRPDPDMAFRMADYRLRVYRRFPEKAMRQVVIYLYPSRSEAVYQTAFEIPGTRHEFEVIRLWEQPPSSFLSSPGLLPLAVLAQTQDRPEVLRRAAAQIECIPDRRTQSNIAASTAILAGLLLDKELIQQILRKEIMQESVIYQDIKAEGRQEGWAEGRQEGKLQGERSLVLRLLQRRLGAVPQDLLAQIDQLPLAQLEALAEALLDFGSETDLRDWLRAHS
jgi:predicted transposase/invertase (TIGR01784 family)